MSGPIREMHQPGVTELLFFDLAPGCPKFRWGGVQRRPERRDVLLWLLHFTGIFSRGNSGPIPLASVPLQGLLPTVFVSV